MEKTMVTNANELPPIGVFTVASGIMKLLHAAVFCLAPRTTPIKFLIETATK